MFSSAVPWLHLLIQLEEVWIISLEIRDIQSFSGGTVVKNLPANARDTGSSPGLGISHMPPSN